MAKKKTRTRKDKSAISCSRQTTGATRKTTNRKMQAAPKVKDKVKAQAARPAAPKQQTMTESEIGSARSEGIRLFKLAGRPTKEQFIRVYGERGPKMTWDQRAAAGVPAGKFQAALAGKIG